MWGYRLVLGWNVFTLGFLLIAGCFSEARSAENDKNSGKKKSKFAKDQQSVELEDIEAAGPNDQQEKGELLRVEGSEKE